jgi:CRISPR-associated protein Csh2
MAFENRREYLFIYTVKDANPNGDPLDANHPRYDEESGQIMVSDVRIKRTVRDQWIRMGKDVFVDGQAKTLKSRIGELKDKLNVKTGREALANCIDTRLFGVTFALGSESFSWTGPVQFKWGRSLHRAESKLVQGTAAFATKDGSDQRSFRNEYIVPFAVIASYGIANQYASEQTGATDQDLQALCDALWGGTANLITRSKIGHSPRFIMEIAYKSGFDGAIGSLDEKVCLKTKAGQPLSDDEQLALRSLSDVTLDISAINGRIQDLQEFIDSVKVVMDKEIDCKGLKELEDIIGGKLVKEER